MKTATPVKTCTKCEVEKPITEFGKNSGGTYGVRSRCKPCIRLLNKIYYDKTPDEYARRGKAWNAANREYATQRSAQWRKDNPEAATEIQRRRYERQKAARMEGWAVPELKVLHEVYGTACVFPGCDKPINKHNPATIDHIVPFSKGGKDTYWNSQPLCKSHNCQKSFVNAEDYRAGHWKYGILVDRVTTV